MVDALLILKPIKLQTVFDLCPGGAADDEDQDEAEGATQDGQDRHRLPEASRCLLQVRFNISQDCQCKCNFKYMCSTTLTCDIYTFCFLIMSHGGGGVGGRGVTKQIDV